MDTATQRLLRERLRDCQNEAADRLSALPDEDDAAPDPLEHLWRRALKAQMREMETAVRRLEEADYGLCEQCRQPIPADRLYAVPWARKCLPCETSFRNGKEILLRSGLLPSLWY